MAGRSDKTRFHATELVGGLIWFAFGGLVYWQALQIKGTQVDRTTGLGGPLFYPRLLAILVMGLAVLQILQHLWRVQRGRLPVAPPRAMDPPPCGALLKSMLSYGGLLVYTFLLDRIGFLLLTPVALVALMLLMGERRWLLMAVYSVGLTAGVYVVFRYAVLVLLPEGLLY